MWLVFVMRHEQTWVWYGSWQDWIDVKVLIRSVCSRAGGVISGTSLFRSAYRATVLHLVTNGFPKRQTRALGGSARQDADSVGVLQLQEGEDI